MENVNIHKQKLITIIIAALVLILLFLPWQKTPALQNSSHMGYVIWGGIICAVGAAAAIANCLLGNKLQPFTKQSKIIAITCFAVIFLFSLIVAIASSGTQQVEIGMGYLAEVKTSAGIGAWITMVVGLAGIAWTSGVLDQLMQQRPGGSMPAPPPPPPPPPTA